jgi:hypothetical protein
LLVLAAAVTVPQTATADGDSNPNRELYPAQARPFGRSMATWAEKASRWIYGTPYDRSPLFDDTSANCAVNQRGPVWYVARIAGPPVFEGTRHCSIPRGRSILLYVGAVVATYPCASDPSYGPAPGQSLYDFLAADAGAAMDTVDLLEVAIDSRSMSRVLEDYRYVSPDLFTIRGDLSLAERLDPCITGGRQRAVVDGFFMMLKALSPGTHTVRVHGTNTFGHNKTFNYFLTIV